MAGVFLCMQLFATAHAAEFGDANHSHDGALCLVQMLSESAASPAPPSSVIVCLIDGHNASALSVRLMEVRIAGNYSIRAPPPFRD